MLVRIPASPRNPGAAWSPPGCSVSQGLTRNNARKQQQRDQQLGSNSELPEFRVTARLSPESGRTAKTRSSNRLVRR